MSFAGFRYLLQNLKRSVSKMTPIGKGMHVFLGLLCAYEDTSLLHGSVAFLPPWSINTHHISSASCLDTVFRSKQSQPLNYKIQPLNTQMQHWNELYVTWLKKSATHGLNRHTSDDLRVTAHMQSKQR